MVQYDSLVVCLRPEVEEKKKPLTFAELCQMITIFFICCLWFKKKEKKNILIKSQCSGWPHEVFDMSDKMLKTPKFSDL